jgi:hypothetical protein
VWKPYYLGEKFFTGVVAGMGLGLPTVASIICSVGGSCQIANRADGPGVEVMVSIPLVPAHELPSRPAHAPQREPTPRESRSRRYRTHVQQPHKH